jgi:hypothetical protein
LFNLKWQIVKKEIIRRAWVVVNDIIIFVIIPILTIAARAAVPKLTAARATSAVGVIVLTFAFITAKTTRMTEYFSAVAAFPYLN